MKKTMLMMKAAVLPVPAKKKGKKTNEAVDGVIAQATTTSPSMINPKPATNREGLILFSRLALGIPAHFIHLSASTL